MNDDPVAKKSSFITHHLSLVFLALRAPVGAACVAILLLVRDRTAAPAARLAAAAVDVRASRFACRASPHQSAGSLYDTSDCDIGELRDFAEWIDAGGEERLRLIDVPDAGDDVLIQEHVADFFAVTLSNPANGLKGIEIV